MELKNKLPVGIDCFKDIRKMGFYYVDKTRLIRELLDNLGEVNSFTRPRRFGKSLNMSMLKAFFEIGCDRSLFDGLEIMRESDLCDQNMGQFPVVSISLKDAGGRTFESACASIRYTIGMEAMRFPFLAESGKLTEEQKNMYRALINVDKTECFDMPDAVLETSLRTLSFLLEKHYGRKIIFLIDEYDVPLDKAFQAGYYDEMVSLIRNLFSNALKSNENLHFAVLTGCLRIAKESIFTGLNNFNVLSITDAHFDDSFGFSDRETREMLSYYGLDAYYDTIKAWYDGYRFGNTSVYCPWDVIKYCYALLADRDARPENYWANTSGNHIVRRFIDKSTRQTREELERLIAGETVLKTIRQEVTYHELDSTIENLWNVLFTTGYLTYQGRGENGGYQLVIPNLEIRELFVSQIMEWFDETSKQDVSKIDSFCEAFPAGDAKRVEEGFNDYLWHMISIRDTFVQKERKENFYHGILLGLLRFKENWIIRFNEESGEGFGNILLEAPESRTGVVIEVKYAERDALDKMSAEALEQIRQRQYDARLIDDGMERIVRFGIACYKKSCRVAVEKG
ncbi:MAG: ATP-binding protein [Lachnospiraceae bacterium]|nr:ATP-binding protein [Butyrivibrio sp.]MCM1343245.1 ATP-binding protein [Muribaculaceae bacterium]MCM1409571.1 ATP-binding protein [Lachnospiraceae bacterium]